jgi:hypothetical protein
MKAILAIVYLLAVAFAGKLAGTAAHSALLATLFYLAGGTVLFLLVLLSRRPVTVTGDEAA